MLRIFAAAFLIAFNSGCGEEEKSSDFIPDIPVECDSGQAADCAGNALPVFVGIIESTAGSDCDDFLTGMNATQRRSAFTVSGTTTSSRAGTLLTATVSEWVNNIGGTADVLSPGNYMVCAFVDTNSNDAIDMNEPVGRGTVAAGQTGFVLTDWSAAYN